MKRDVIAATIGHMSKQKPWTDADLGFVSDTEDWPADEVGFELGRSADAIYKMRSKLRSGWTPQRESWTRDEDLLIRNTPHMTAKQVAAKLGRTEFAVSHRRKTLASVHGVSFGGNNKSPFQIAHRPLLARTCLKCGLLLQAKWFHFNTSKSGFWEATCSRCHPRGPARKRPYNKKTRTQMVANKARYQAMTQPLATRAGEPWLEADYAVLMDPDLTLLEKALRLERTYQATQVACSRNGYKSKVGLGDPERDQWKINNPNAKEYAL